MILVLGAIAGIGFLVIVRMFGSWNRVSEQYAILEKRFGLERKVHKSRWGAGIREKLELRGSFRGYEISLGTVPGKTGKKRSWFSAVSMEVTFASEHWMEIELENSQPEAVYPRQAARSYHSHGYPVADTDSSDLIASLRGPKIRHLLAKLQRCERAGAFRLKRGFLEYRESGELISDGQRERFQLALLILAELADALAVNAVKLESYPDLSNRDPFTLPR